MSKLLGLIRDLLVALYSAYQPNEFDIRENSDPIALTEMNHGWRMKMGVKGAYYVSFSSYRRLEHMNTGSLIGALNVSSISTIVDAADRDSR